MENAVDALKMAGSVLLFIIGLTTAILSFSQAREAVDTVLAYSDRPSLDYEDERFFYNANQNGTDRYVGLETIIPTIYRSYKENYRIVFDFPDDNYYLYTLSDKDNEKRQIKYIDLEKQMITNEIASNQFLDGIIYHDFEYGDGKDKGDYEYKFVIEPSSKSLMSYINEKLNTGYKIKESLGTYIQEDVLNDINVYDDSSDYKKQLTTFTPSSTRFETEKRVITYTFVKN